MNYIPLSLRVGGSVWYYTLFLNVEVIGSLIRMVAHSITSDLVRELWRNIREKGSQEEFDLKVEIDFDGIKSSYPFKIRFTNDEFFEKDLNEKLTKTETLIVNDLSRLSLRNMKFRKQNQ